MGKTCGKNASRNNCEVSVQEYLGRNKVPLESQDSDGWTILKII
jgi:hypothetical protein